MGERRCNHCGALYDGSFLWDVHYVPGADELVDTCSPRCRDKLGLRERKAVKQ